MWLLILALVLALEAVSTSAEDCNEEYERCRKIAIGLPDMSQIASGEGELKVLCPIVEETFQCVEDLASNCVGQSISELANNEDETISKGADVLLNLKSLASDLCSSDNPLNQAYVKHATCYDEIEVTTLGECLLESKRFSSQFLNLDEDFEDLQGVEVKYSESSHVEESEGNEVEEGHTPSIFNPNKRSCVEATYALGCISAEIHENCGDEARATFQQIVKRSKLLRSFVCSEEDLYLVRDSFIKSVEEENGDYTDIMTKLFDFRKRK